MNTIATLPPAYVRGIGFCAPHLPAWSVAREALAGRHVDMHASKAPRELAASGEKTSRETPASRPKPAVLPPAEARRAPESVLLAVQAASEACAHAAVDARDLASVFASTEGDLAIHDALCETLATNPALMSPTKFHNSVHNAPAGYWTIATACLRPYTAVSAHAHTFGAGLLEALTQVAIERRPVLYVAYDIEARGPLRTLTASRGALAVALVLAPEPLAHAGAVRLTTGLRTPRDDATPLLSRDRVAALADNAMASALPLFEALALRSSRRIAHTAGPDVMLELGLDFPDEERA